VKLARIDREIVGLHRLAPQIDHHLQIAGVERSAQPTLDQDGTLQRERLSR
jgi:hypothetical protein